MSAREQRKPAGAAPVQQSQMRLRAQIGALQRRLMALNAEADEGVRRLLGDAVCFLGAALGRLQDADRVVTRGAAEVARIEDIGERRELTALYESEQRFQSAFDDAPVGMLLAKPDGHPLRVNRALWEMLGYSPAELLLMRPHQITHPDDVALAVERLAATMAGDQNGGPIDLRYLHKNGRVVWGRTAGSLVRDPNREPLHMIVHIEDITERKEAEQALRESEEKFRTLAETIPSAAFIFQGEKLRYVNSSAERITGYTRDELLRMAFWEVIHPEFRPLVRARGLARQGGEAPPSQYEAKLRTKTGDERWVQFSAGVIPFEGHVAVLGTAFDITDRKRSEGALRASEAKNKAILDASPDTFIRIRRDGTILDVKGDTSGWRTPPEYAMGRNLAQLMPLELVSPALETIVRAMATGQMQTYEFESATAHGVMCFEARIVACGEDEALCSLRDITARRHAEDEARQRLTDLAHVARVSNMGEMAAALAHELNQPLMAIVAYASGCALRLESGSVESPDLQAALRQVSQQAVRAGEILRRVRDFVRKGRPQRNRVDVNDLAREVAGLAEGEARAHAVTVRLELGAMIPPAMGDPIQIEQVMLNLIRNGIEAMSETAEPRILTLRTSCLTNDVVAVTIIDRGIGLPGDIEDLFEPFVSTKVKGLGLGLSISRSIVEAHGGRLSGWSDDARNTTFQFTLPVARKGRP